jgi:acetoin utilization protein AcuB
MFVRSHMTREPVCAGPAAVLGEIVQAMVRHQIHHLPIVNETRHVLGIISDHKLRAAADRPDVHWANIRADAIMSRSPPTVESDASFGHVLTRLCAHGTDALLVLEQGVLAGILTRADFLRALSKAFALDADGSTVEVSLRNPADLFAAFEVLHRHGAEIVSAVAGRMRDDGDEPVLCVRLGTRHPRAVEKALAEAALTLLVPEEELRASNGVQAASPATP